jgi:hypothetical protein
MQNKEFNLSSTSNVDKNDINNHTNQLGNLRFVKLKILAVLNKSLVLQCKLNVSTQVPDAFHSWIARE